MEIMLFSSSDEKSSKEFIYVGSDTVFYLDRKLNLSCSDNSIYIVKENEKNSGRIKKY